VETIRKIRQAYHRDKKPIRQIAREFHLSKNTARKTIRHADILELHRILAGEVMDQGEAGTYRTISVRVGNYLPPPPDAVSVPCALFQYFCTVIQQGCNRRGNGAAPARKIFRARMHKIIDT